jgi:hypothetical protein
VLDGSVDMIQDIPLVETIAFCEESPGTTNKLLPKAESIHVKFNGKVLAVQVIPLVEVAARSRPEVVRNTPFPTETSFHDWLDGKVLEVHVIASVDDAAAAFDPETATYVSTLIGMLPSSFIAISNVSAVLDVFVTFIDLIKVADPDGVL